MNKVKGHIPAEESWRNVYFLGIGGIGMSALARMLKAQGVNVSGYDRTESKLTQELISQGIPVHYEENTGLIPSDLDLAVYTPAIPENNKEFVHLSASDIPLMKRAELLGFLTRDKRLIAVAGTHGKTSISCWIAHILNQGSNKCNALLGGISKNLGSNLVFEPETDLFVTEADEYDRSFLQLEPWIAVITSTDADHLDIYGDHQHLKNSFRSFTSKIKPNGKLLIKKGIELFTEVNESVSVYSYSLSEKADFHAININVKSGINKFDLVTPFREVKGLQSGIPGIINLENAVAASAVAILTNADEETVKSGLSSFKGVKRRFDIRIERDNFIYIDDYAHHPNEIKACIDSVRKLYPEKKITGVFQPHLYTRTRDFASEFAQSLKALDIIILLDIYPARELPIEGVSSENLLKMIDHQHKYLCAREDLISFLKVIKPEILLTLGAGDIDRLVEPIETTFKAIHS